jgi:hypothetical protein
MRMTPQEQAQADRLAKQVNDKAAAFLLDPAEGHRQGYRPTPTIIRNDDLHSAGTGPRVDSQVLLSDWLKAIAEKDLAVWRWRIDRGVIPNEIEILGPRL